MTYTVIMLTNEITDSLIHLAKKYETFAFLEKDPSQFMHRYRTSRDQEAVAFLASSMSFGQRKQILSHVETVLKSAGNSPSDWIIEKGYKKLFTNGDNSFYRMYTHNDFLIFFDTLRSFLLKSDTIGNHFKNLYLSNTGTVTDTKHNTDSNSTDTSPTYLSPLICTSFPENCHLIPHTKGTAAKRVNMFLRWMVRDKSPVDLGLWKDWYHKKDLLIPLDTHVMQEAAKLGLFETTKNGNIPSASMKTAVQLTGLMDQVFPGDPCKADFALFGLGVDKEEN